jgi:hypothetical protein
MMLPVIVTKNETPYARSTFSACVNINLYASRLNFAGIKLYPLVYMVFSFVKETAITSSKGAMQITEYTMNIKFNIRFDFLDMDAIDFCIGCSLL